MIREGCPRAEYVYHVIGDGYFDKFVVGRVEIIKRGKLVTKVVDNRASGYRRVIRNDVLERGFAETPEEAIAIWRADTKKRIQELRREADHLERAIRKTPKVVA